jgi:hypothetical protein
MSEELNAGESAEISPDHTPESEVEIEAVEESPAEIETEESVTEEVPVEEVAEEEVVTDFSDLNDNFIPSPEQIAKLRIPKEDKERLQRVAELATKAQTVVDEMGGDFGVNALKPFAQILSKPELDTNEGDAVLNALFDANPNVAYQLFATTARGLLQQDQSGDQILQATFGENASVRKIKALLKLDAEGLVDEEWAGQEDPEKDELRAEVAALKAQMGQPAKVDDRAERAIKDFGNDFHSEIPQKLQPLFERVNWSPERGLGKLVQTVIQYQLKENDKFTDTEKFLGSVGTYRNGEKRVPLADANIHLLKNQAFAIGKELIREIQEDMKAISQKSRNKVIAEKQKAPEVKTVPQPLPQVNETFEERQARLRQAYLAQSKG